MLTKRTILDQLEITRHGHIQVRLRKEIVDGKAVVAYEYHRTIVECGGDCEAQFAVVNEHLRQLGCEPIERGAIDLVKAHARVAWTPERIETASADLKRRIAEVTAQHAKLAERSALLVAAARKLEIEEHRLAERARNLRAAKRDPRT